MKHIMVDLETMSTSSYAAIASIGAVLIEKNKITKEFYRKIELQSCVDAGLQIDIDTILWWMKQKDSARKELYKENEKENIYKVLLDFANWIGKENYNDVKVWGNGSDFDNVILKNAYEKCGLSIPWKFWNNRCYRTVKNLFPNVKKPETGVAHNALDDARNQAIHLINMKVVLE